MAVQSEERRLPRLTRWQMIFLITFTLFIVLTSAGILTYYLITHRAPIVYAPSGYNTAEGALFCKNFMNTASQRA